MSEAKPEITAARIEKLRAMLREGTRREKLDAMVEAAIAGPPAAALVPIFGLFLGSQDYVPVSERDYDFSGNAPLATAAMSAIEAIGAPPDPAQLRRLLADRRVFELPEASYDQGAYIGDYGTEYVAPAALAAQLVPLLGQGAFALLPDLVRNGRDELKLIWESAIAAIGKFVALLPEASPADRAALAEVVAEIEGLPDVVVNTRGERAFALREVARLYRRRLVPGWEPGPKPFDAEISYARACGFQARMVRPIAWQAVPWFEFPPEGIFGEDKAWLLYSDIEFFATFEGEDLFLIRHTVSGFPDPPEFELLSRPAGQHGEAWQRWGQFADLPEAWAVPT